MIKANNTFFWFYLAMMDSFREYLSRKYPDRSQKDAKRYQTVIIDKIVRMFHSLELLTKDTLDVVSARCVLRGILDSVTTYCFIYHREDTNDILFRHYLYALNGWREYQKSVIGISKKSEYAHKEDYLCTQTIKQIEENLHFHPFFVQYGSTIETIIQNANWRYESLQNPRSIKYGEMYALVGFDIKLTKYFQGFCLNLFMVCVLVI